MPCRVLTWQQDQSCLLTPTSAREHPQTGHIHTYPPDFAAVFIINIIFIFEHPFKGEMKSNHLQRK